MMPFARGKSGMAKSQSNPLAAGQALAEWATHKQANSYVLFFGRKSSHSDIDL